MNFPSQTFFNDINHGYRAAILKKNYLWLLPFYMVVATYFYYEKVRRTMRTAIVSDLLNTKSQQKHPSWVILLKSIFYQGQNYSIKEPTEQSLKRRDHVGYFQTSTIISRCYKKYDSDERISSINSSCFNSIMCPFFENPPFI